MKITANNGKTYTLPNNPAWHRGPPPELGWWPASTSYALGVLRFWDGKNWSVPVRPYFDGNRAYRESKIKTFDEISKKIQWADRWWL